MNHSRVAFAACLSLLLAASTGSFAQAPTTAPAKSTLSPQMEAAIRQLNADAFEDRQKAVQFIQQAYAEQLRSLLTLDDPEAQARMATVMEYNDGLCRWALDTLKLPMDQRKKLIAWGLTPDMAPTLAKIYSANVDRRIEGVKDLANAKGPEVSTLLARLLNDDAREVYVAAMDAAWSREPTPEMVDVLWNRAVEAGLSMYQPRVFNQVNNQIKFQGRVLGATNIYNPYNKFTDNDIATDTLIHLKAPQVAVRLKALFDKIQKEPNTPVSQTLLMPYNEPMKNIFRLLEAYKVKSVIPILAELALHPQQRNGNNFGNQGFYWSNRTAVLATVVKMTDQKLEDYHLKRSAQMNNMWVSPSENVENESIKKFEEWWTQHKADYVAATEPSSTQPATPGGIAPANPAQPAAPARGALAPQPIPLQVQAQNIQLNGPAGGIITITGAGGQVTIQQQIAPPPVAQPPEKPVDAPAK